MYATELFSDGRFLHVGIDIGAPVGTPCMAFDDGEIAHFGYNPDDGDYGNVIVTSIWLESRQSGRSMGICARVNQGGRRLARKFPRGR